MKGIGVFFNQMYDLSRFQKIADKIDWIAPIMAPDQSAVQHNRSEWDAWRKALPTVRFYAWLVCDDPEQDFERAEWLVNNYQIDGLLLNCEKAYESTGKWKGSVLVNNLNSVGKLAGLPKILSYPSTPAERYDMDYRAFERAGYYFAPQAYWLDPQLVSQGTDARPKTLYVSTNLPKQIHVGRDYRLQVYHAQGHPWGRIVQWDGSDHCVIKDLRANKLYRVPVIPKQDGAYKYMQIPSTRIMYDYKTGKTVVGKLLGFQSESMIGPTVGVYDNCYPSPDDIRAELDKIGKRLTGASVYLGETSTSDHVTATWEAVHN